MAFASGGYEAICFLSFGKVFTAFQTGNIVFLGLGLAGTRPPLGPVPLTVVVSLAAFAAGAMVVMRVLKSFDGDQELDDDQVFQVWPGSVSVALGIALVVQAGFLVVWLAVPPSGLVTNVLIGLNAFAMGMQMNAVRSLHVPGISTTAATATFISLASGLATWSHTAPAVRRLTGVLVATVFGALVGDWMLGHAHAEAPVVPLLVIAVVVAVALVAFRPERGGARTATPKEQPAG
jgi:uncharacterized membrane protein YoaK (UPF0700 family)